MSSVLENLVAQVTLTATDITLFTYHITLYHKVTAYQFQLGMYVQYYHTYNTIVVNKYHLHGHAGFR